MMALLRYPQTAERKGLVIYSIPGKGGGWGKLKDLAKILGRTRRHIKIVISTSRKGKGREPRFEEETHQGLGRVVRATHSVFTHAVGTSRCAPPPAIGSPGSAGSADSSSGIKRGIKRACETDETDGLASSAASGIRTQSTMARARETDESGECVVCTIMPAHFAMVPCGHLCACEMCRHSMTSCPICRQDVRQTLRVYPVW